MKIDGFHDENEHYLMLAIQTVLRQNRPRLRMLQDSNFHPTLLKELSRDILLKAQWFKELSETLSQPPLATEAENEERLDHGSPAG